MRCAICGHFTTSEIPSPVAGGPAHECWRWRHVFTFKKGRPFILVPGPHERADALGEPTYVPCPTCCADSSATSDRPFPVYKCAAAEAHFFSFARNGTVIPLEASWGDDHGQEQERFVG